MHADTSCDTELARRATGGDGEAFGLLSDRWLDRAFDVAWHILHDRDAAADATQEAFASAWQQIGNLRQPESFGGWLLRITRNKALNLLQKRQRSSPVGSEETLVTMDTRQAGDPTAPLDQQEHHDLVWAASAALGEEDASLLALHLRHELGPPELAEELGVKPNAAHQRLFRLKKRLAEAIGAWVLWRKGTPSCPDLSRALDRAGITGFDGTTAKAIVAHTRGCEACDGSRKLRLSPEALFTTLPLVAAGSVLRARMVAALEGQGVPVPSGGDGPGADSSPEPDGPSEPPETDEQTELDLPGQPDERGTPETSRASRWRRTAVGVGATIAALVVLGGAALTVLASRAGDGVEDAAEPRSATGADIADDEPTAAPTSEIGEHEPSTTSATTEGEATAAPDDPAPPELTGTQATPGAGTETATTTTGGTRSDGATDQPEPPDIHGFTVFSTGQPCRSTVGGTVEATITWEISDAASSTLGPEGGPAEPVPSAGSVSRCAVPGSTWVLTASGQGGRAIRRTQVRDIRPPSGPADLANP